MSRGASDYVSDPSSDLSFGIGVSCGFDLADESRNGRVWAVCGRVGGDTLRSCNFVASKPLSQEHINPGLGS